VIEIVGLPGNPEYEAALQLKEAFIRTWPGIDSSPVESDHIKIASRAKLSGQKVSDIDIVVVANLRTKRYVIAKAGTLDADGSSIAGLKVRVRSFVVAVEVKDHSEHSIICEAGGVKVSYSDGWKDATGQNEDQRYSLMNYLRDNTAENPWVYRCLILRGIQELPKHRGVTHPIAGAVAGSFDANAFLIAMASVNGLRKMGGEYVISSTKEEDIIEMILSDGLFKTLKPSGLDRKRMDRIASRPAEAREIADLLGRKRIHLRGNGGTGKTVLLMQSAYEAFIERGCRSLVLTYNTALAADIQRTLALMGISGGGETGGITVRTVMSFMYGWLERLGLGSESGIPFEEYEAKCAEAQKYLKEGVITSAEVDAFKKAGGFDLDFDAILVDEAQDWPQVESELLVSLYGAERIALADGLSQLVRGTATDWKSPKDGLAAGGGKVLREGLRMKANLCRFANALADEVGFQWHVTPNKQALGGRIKFFYGDYAKSSNLQRELLASAIEAGNLPIDLLHCVPPSHIDTSNGKRESMLATAFARQGWEVWDGVDEAARRSFPRSTGALRIVQYESCRGLEGWTAVLDGLDEFWDRKREESLSYAVHPGEAEAIAWRWCMIPLTRPIDTLVIALRSKDSPLSKVIEKVAASLPDIVEAS